MVGAREIQHMEHTRNTHTHALTYRHTHTHTHRHRHAHIRTETHIHTVCTNAEKGQHANDGGREGNAAHGTHS